MLALYKNKKLIPPTTYQGGKQRIAGKLLDLILPDPNQIFCDLCCGSGSISIELVNRGFDPAKVIMLDQGPWGVFWESVGNGTFDLDRFRHFCLNIMPKDPREVSPFVKSLVDIYRDAQNIPYVFLIAQAASFGGKAVWHDGIKYHHNGFRSYWTPTETSNRRSPVNPMMPMPETLFQRVKNISERMKGVTGICGDIDTYTPPEDATVYVDPPYDNTTAYGYTFDVNRLNKRPDNRWFVSEGKPLTEKAVLVAGSTVRKKGGISGSRTAANEEWLSEFQATSNAASSKQSDTNEITSETESDSEASRA